MTGPSLSNEAKAAWTAPPPSVSSCAADAGTSAVHKVVAARRFERDTLALLVDERSALAATRLDDAGPECPPLARSSRERAAGCPTVPRRLPAQARDRPPVCKEAGIVKGCMLPRLLAGEAVRAVRDCPMGQSRRIMVSRRDSSAALGSATARR